jgi:16S rRNA (uracil1498-N3)-methyltransferase
MRRFYCPDADFNSNDFSLTDSDELHHLRDVLRLKKDAVVSLFDGKGTEASGRLVAVTSRKADIHIQSVRRHLPRAPKIILACALPKKSKFEFIIEKATELGVDEIIPLKTHRTEIVLQGSRLDKKNLRYQAVAVTASKQSARPFMPVIHPISEFSSTVEFLTKTTTALIPSLQENREHLLSALQKITLPDAVSFLIGPEGDFTPEEYAEAGREGCIAVSLGDTILRVETAALCAVSCANLFFHG